MHNDKANPLLPENWENAKRLLETVFAPNPVSKYTLSATNRENPVFHVGILPEQHSTSLLRDPSHLADELSRRSQALIHITSHDIPRDISKAPQMMVIDMRAFCDHFDAMAHYLTELKRERDSAWYTRHVPPEAGEEPVLTKEYRYAIDYLDERFPGHVRKKLEPFDDQFDGTLMDATHVVVIDLHNQENGAQILSPDGIIRIFKEAGIPAKHENRMESQGNTHPNHCILINAYILANRLDALKEAFQQRKSAPSTQVTAGEEAARGTVTPHAAGPKVVSVSFGGPRGT